MQPQLRRLLEGELGGADAATTRRAGENGRGADGLRDPLSAPVRAVRRARDDWRRPVVWHAVICDQILQKSSNLGLSSIQRTPVEVDIMKSRAVADLVGSIDEEVCRKRRVPSEGMLVGTEPVFAEKTILLVQHGIHT